MLFDLIVVYVIYDNIYMLYLLLYRIGIYSVTYYCFTFLNINKKMIGGWGEKPYLFAFSSCIRKI